MPCKAMLRYRCPVKSGNERDPCPLLPRLPAGRQHSGETAADKAEEGMGDGRSVWPESAGIHAAYNGWHKGLIAEAIGLWNGMRPRKNFFFTKEKLHQKKRFRVRGSQSLKPVQIRIEGCNSPS